ncbi:MAG: aldo/keto reductase [Coriobacteriales bacterium]|jgi:predicted aldo/keto reductase-like oxidoreductase
MTTTINKLGFGLLRLPRVGGAASDSDAPFDWEAIETMVDRFLELGGTYFDTCYTYLDGNSEEAVRRCLAARHPRDAFQVAEKIPGYKCTSPDDARRFLDEEFARCGIDRFDVLMLHWLNDAHYEIAQRLDQFRFLVKCREEGSADRIGFSFHGSAALLERILNEHPEVDIVQIQLNYLDWESAGIESRACYEACVRHGKTVVVMEPVRGGTLAELPAEAEGLLRAAHPDWAPADWALRFAQSLPGVEVCLSGMSTMAQVEANLEPFEPLGERDIELLADARAIIEREQAVPCTACGYCLEHCPAGIAIPTYFKMLNELARYPGEGWKIKPAYAELASRVPGPADCIGCRTCEGHCPQGIAIPDRLKDVAAQLG